MFGEVLLSQLIREWFLVFSSRGEPKVFVLGRGAFEFGFCIPRMAFIALLERLGDVFFSSGEILGR